MFIGINTDAGLAILGIAIFLKTTLASKQRETVDF